MTYGSGQRLAFAGLVIGFLLCATGAIAPFWQQGSITIDKFADVIGEKIPLIGEVKLATVYGGLWWYCYTLVGDRKCDVYNLASEDATTTWVVRIACVVNVLLALACALVALCRTCCCNGGKTIFHGLLAFLAGGAGIVAIGVFAVVVEDGFAMKFDLVQYGWAFYIYIVGAAVMIVVSFLLCFASPNNPLTPMIISSVNNVLPNGRYTRMSDERVLIEEPGTYPRVSYPQVQSY